MNYKSNKENLDPVELREYQKAAQIYLRLSETDMGKALEEVSYDEEEIP